MRALLQTFCSGLRNNARVPSLHSLPPPPNLAELSAPLHAGFEKPSAIQQRAILPITSGRDVIAQAQSGTGKTSMISVALIQQLDTATRECAA